MRIACVGIGGVGGFYGGKLALAYGSSREHEVIFVARGEHLQAINQKGLHLVTQDGTFTAVPTMATDNPAAAGLFDVVLFAVKSYGLEQAASQIAGNVHEKTVIVPLLNGVDISERLRAALPKADVLGGCVYISAFIEGPGAVKQVGGSCQLIFGPENGNVSAYQPVQDLFAKAGIKSELTNDPLVPLWTKFVFISPAAGITSMLMKPFGAIMADEGSRDLLMGLIKETLLISKAKGVKLPPDIVEVTLGKVGAFPYETKTSLQLDFEKGKPTELETFTGYIVKAGKDLGIPTPLHDEVYERLKAKKSHP
jgi:2-dehydropantoate 2-reductase